MSINMVAEKISGNKFWLQKGAYFASGFTRNCKNGVVLISRQAASALFQHPVKRSHSARCWSLRYLFPIISIITSLATASTENEPSTDRSTSLALYYSANITKYWILKKTVPGGDLQLLFARDTLQSWKASGVDVFPLGLASPKGKGVTFGEGSFCSIGITDESTSCFISGLTANYKPTHIITNFNRTNDIGMVFIDFNAAPPIRQLLVYRPGIGSIYMSQFSNFPEVGITRFDFVLDSFTQNRNRYIFLKGKEIEKLRSASDRLKAWILKLDFNDAMQPPRKFHWNQLILDK